MRQIEGTASLDVLADGSVKFTFMGEYVAMTGCIDPEAALSLAKKITDVHEMIRRMKDERK